MKKYLLYLMAALYIFAGVNHFWHPDFYLKMLVGFLPYPEALNYLSGIAEIVIGIGLLFPATRRISAWALIALLVAVFPANINMAIHHEQFGLPATGLYLRLPVQLLLIWWAYVYTRPSK